jgi:MFS family permease
LAAAARAEPTRPTWIARLPFYYGWVNVVVAAVAMSATLPGRTYGLALIKEPLRASLVVSDLRFNVLNFWAIILGSALVLPTGWLIDRFGVRSLLVAVAAALGCAVLAMSQVWDPTSLFIALTLVRGLGQGALSVVAIALVGKWFKRRAGPAMGVFAVLLAVGCVAPIFAVGEAVQQLGWRAAWAWVGYVLLLGLAPFGGLIARSSPESCGVQPDEPAADDAGSGPSAGLRDAAGTAAFWVFALAASLFNFALSALTLDSEVLLQERGLDGRSLNSLVLGILMFSGLPTNLVVGWLARRVSMGKLLAVGMAVLAASLLLFPLIGGVPMAVIYAAVLGVSGGIITVIYFAVFGHTYGRGHLGVIQAAVQVLTVLASASGPVVLAGCRELLGATDLFFWVFALAAVLLAMLAWLVKLPRSPAGGTPDAPRS